MKKLGFGLMRLPLLDAHDKGNIDLALSKKMVDAYLERGFTYFDTAYMYCDGKSESAAKEILVSRYPRESYTLATKLPPHMLKDRDSRDAILQEQLERTGAGYFDYYLLHCIDDETIHIFESLDCFTWLLEKKKSGLVKNIGFSFHGDAALLERVLAAHPIMDFVQLQINYLDWESPRVQSRACYEVAVRYGIPVIVMEPVKGGALANVPPTVEAMLTARDAHMSVSSWAVRFAASLPNVVMVLSGMSDMQQVLDNTSYMQNLKPLTAEEAAMLHIAADMINGQTAIPCTGCAYCVENCPQQIAIPSYFALYNEDVRVQPDAATAQGQARYVELGRAAAPADACVQCGNCEVRCPQHLAVRTLLQEVAARFRKIG